MRKGKANLPVAERGFTLIELLVSIGLFSVVAVIVAGVTSSIIDSNKKAQTITSVTNNLNYTLESMTREIKTGTGLDVNGTGGDACSDTVSVTDARGRDVTYFFDEADQAVALDVNGDSSPITAPEINVESLQFCILPGVQPAVLITISGVMELSGGTISSRFEIQTTIAQRALNIS